MDSVLIAPKLQLQKKVSLSSCGAKYKTLTDRSNKELRICQLLENIGITV